MAAQSSNAANATVSFSQKLNKMTAAGSPDYNSWRSLILEIETASPEDIDAISLAYGSFLSMFPLCHWHLEKYAYQKAKLCGAQEAVKIYEQGVGVAMFSVGFWVAYFTFGTNYFGDPEDVRRLFGRTISFVGKDYFCHVLWDKYMKYEFNQEGWSFLAESYIQALRFPTKKLHFYYDNFKQFVANLEEEVEYEKNNGVSVPCAPIEISRDEISLVVKDLLDSSDRSLKSKALDRYRSIGEQFYEEACKMDKKIKCFETNIRRRYFCVTPLDDDQLDNWHLYLDFIEKQDNLDWAVNVFERCLIPCANYPEFWMRYAEFLESKGGHELAISALDRATQIFLKNVPEIHLFSARFKEHIGDVNGARAALLLCDTKTDSSFIEKVVTLANLERRLGNSAAASAMYEKALETAREKRRLRVLPSLYSHFARLTFLITGSAAAAQDVLIEGVHNVPNCTSLLEELIKFVMTHEGASQLNIIDSIIADAISPGSDEYDSLNANDRENISCLFLEFVNLCGTTHDIRKAWNRHIKLFPQFLRMKTTYKHPTPGNYSSDVIRKQKGKQVLESPVNHEIQPNWVLGKQPSLMSHNNDAKETVQAPRTKAIVLSNEDACKEMEPAFELSCQSREDELEPMAVSAELADRSKENALDQDLSCQPRGDKPVQMDVSPELAKQSEKNALSPHESAQEVGKTSETIESAEPDLNHELKQQKHPVSLDNISLNSQEKESQNLIPMPCDEYETKRSMPASGESKPRGISNVNVNSFAAPKSISTEESPQVHNDLERDGSVTRQHNRLTKIHMDPEEPSSAGEDSIEIDHMVPAPGHATSVFQEHAQDQEHQLEQSLYHGPQVESARQDSPRQKCSQAQLGAVEEDEATDQDRPMSMMTPPAAMLAPLSSQSVSYPQQSMNHISQHPWQTQQSIAMNQMIQYHYHQQQLLQQQYQQQLQLQHPYLQLQQHYMSQQAYQLQPQQHNQQHVQLGQQQHYVQQQQLQQSQQQLQQQNNQQNQQILGHQPQDIAHQAHQLAYQQHASQGQQLLLQQYQQYQGYQHLQNQQQSQEGPIHLQVQYGHQHHPSQKQQDELLQQHHQHVISKQNLTQNQLGSKIAPPNSDAAVRPSDSPHHWAQSPDDLQ